MKTRKVRMSWLVGAVACLAVFGANGCPFYPDTGASMTWAKRAGGDGSDRAYALAGLTDGSCIVTGNFSLTARFGIGEPNETSLTVRGLQDVPIIKLNPDGSLAWVKQEGGPAGEYGYGVATFADGSFVVTGYFEDEATFGEGEEKETRLVNAGFQDVFVARFNADGTLAWAVSAGGPGEDKGNAVSACADDSCVITGYFEHSASFGDGSPAAVTLNSAGGHDIFVAKYAANGALLWAVGAGGPDEDEGAGLAAVEDGGCVVTGRFASNASFGSEEDAVALASSGLADIFLARYDALGGLAWAVAGGGPGPDKGRSVSRHPDGAYLLVGNYSETATFGAGQTLASNGGDDILMARYNTDGTPICVRGAGGPESDVAYSAFALPDGSCLIAGSFRATATFPAGLGCPAMDPQLISIGEEDVFVAKYRADGAMSWIRHVGSEDADMGLAVTALTDGSCIAAGRFRRTIVFGQGQPNEATFTGFGGGCCDIFVVKYPS